MAFLTRSDNNSSVILSSEKSNSLVLSPSVASILARLYVSCRISKHQVLCAQRVALSRKENDRYAYIKLPGASSSDVVTFLIDSGSDAHIASVCLFLTQLENVVLL